MERTFEVMCPSIDFFVKPVVLYFTYLNNTQNLTLHICAYQPLCFWLAFTHTTPNAHSDLPTIVFLACIYSNDPKCPF